MKDLILVVGASGTVGTELVSLFKKQGVRVRATTSKKVKSSDELVHMNLVTGEGIRDGFEGVDKAFFLTPPGYADQHALLSPLIQEAKRRGLKKVVMMTVIGADKDESSAFRRAEIELEKSGLNYNILRPNWFLQNFNSFWLQGIQEQGKLILPAGQAKVSFIDARDIAAVAAKLLTADKFDRQSFDLTGAQAVDHAEAAKALQKVSGREIAYQEISPMDFKQALTSAGLPVDYVDFLLKLFGFLRNGDSARTTSAIQDVTGQKPRTIEQYANDYKQNWIQQ